MLGRRFVQRTRNDECVDNYFHAIAISIFLHQHQQQAGRDTGTVTLVSWLPWQRM